jgi:hypothetical protein
LRRGYTGDTLGGDGEGAIWLRFFRPKRNGKGWKNRDRYDGRAHEGGCVLRQHVARSHAQIGHRDDKRQRGGRIESKRQQVALGEHALVQANRNGADEEKARAKEDQAGLAASAGRSNSTPLVMKNKGIKNPEPIDIK